MSMITQFKAARRVSTPIVAVRTPDPAATILTICNGFTNGDKDIPLTRWDIIRGMTGLNEAGQQAVDSILGDSDPSVTSNPAACLELAQKLPKGAILFWLNAQRYVDNDGVAQAIWNLRDQFKSNRRTLVLLCPSIKLPPELSQDVAVLDEPLPTREEIAGIVKQQYGAAREQYPEIPELEEALQTRAVDALCGLAAFPAEQVTAMSLTKTGVDVEALWERKRQIIEQTPGLSVWRGGETFKDIGGVENVKTFLLKVLTGRKPPRAIVFIDEIEKALAGSSGPAGDTSGVSQSMLGSLLTFMQDKQATGCIFIGPPGAAKSAVAKATGAEAGIPTISFDLSGMKDSLVGASEARLRDALKVVSAVSQDNALFIATCNSIGVLPPELRRRFGFGTFFFSLPDKEERDAIWTIYKRKFPEISEHEIPNDDGWTGAEIKQCAELAWRLNCSLIDASVFVVPVSVSAGEQIDKLCRQAHNRYVSAGKPGLFKYEKLNRALVSEAARQVEIS